MLTAEAVEKIFRHSFFVEEEMSDEALVTTAAVGEGIMNRYGFHPERLESHREEVKELLGELSSDFQETGGGGMSFLNACMDKNERQWGEHINVEMLMSLGLALGLVEYCAPRELWPILPGGMPYFVVKNA